MKKFIFLTMCAICALTMSAQRVGGGNGYSSSYSGEPRKVTFGVRAGLNVASLDENAWNEDANDKPKSLIGFKVGAICDIPIWRDLSLQPGLYISMKGGKIENYDSYYDAHYRTISIKPIYLDIPVLAVYHIRLANGIDLQPAIGPYFSFGIGGKSKRTYYYYDDRDEKYDLFGEDDGRDDDEGGQMFRRFDCGLSLGFGVNWHKFYAGLNYDLGLYNVYNEEMRGSKDEYHCKNRVFTVSVGYNF